MNNNNNERSSLIENRRFTSHGFTDQLSRLRENDPYFTNLILRLDTMERDSSQNFPHWRDAIFSHQLSQWVEAIQTNNSIESVIVDMTVSDTTIWEKRQCYKLLNAIGALPCLEKLEFYQSVLGEPGRMGSIAAITQAVQNTRLLMHLAMTGKTVREGSEEELGALVNAFQQCRHLESLSIIGFQLSKSHVAIFSPILRMQSLKKLHFENTSNAFVPLIEMLSTNARLTTLILEFKDQLVDVTVVQLADVLKVNRTLQDLSLLNSTFLARTESLTNPSGISEQGYRALREMTEQNFVLQHMNVQGLLDADIDFYLKLNRAGRQRLFESSDSSPKNWVTMIAKVAEDPECIFYFLQLNPSLCDVF